MNQCYVLYYITGSRQDYPEFNYIGLFSTAQKAIESIGEQSLNWVKSYALCHALDLCHPDMKLENKYIHVGVSMDCKRFCAEGCFGGYLIELTDIA